ncbi:disco-interacting protein 2 homolog C [Lates japonicus]|uniref:Disco-interacting protein 2 homolog C n=1 Tax=Lates japonicus TaxID=270547 RepID=A0AAD3MBM5_LATJO|nr:disco-interacting protein 2 homolog C [Lates japonicus]
MADRDPVPLPAEVRAKLAELELELSEGEYLDFTAEARRLCPALLLLLLLLGFWGALSRCWSVPAERTNRFRV